MQYNNDHRLLPLVLGFLLSLLLSCTQQKIPVTPVHQVKPASPSASRTEVVIAAVGDIMMPESIQSAVAQAEHGYDLLFEKITPDLAAADITFANLETPVNHKAGVSGYPKFNAPRELLSSLKKAGVDIVSLANNHAMDAGSDGLKRTIDNVEAAGIVFIGAGRSNTEALAIRKITVRGITAAFLAYTYSTNQRLPRTSVEAPVVNVLGQNSAADLARAAASVRQARADADLVVVSLHWGDEYATSPTAWQRRVASELIEAGADVLIGHHPHVLQPIESCTARDGRTGLVAYSLGNFISSQSAEVSFENKTHRKALRGDGIILSITATKEGGRTRVAHAEFLPIWTLRESISKATVSRPVSLARELLILGAKGKRDSTEQRLFQLLSYRQEYIIKTLIGKPE